MPEVIIRRGNRRRFAIELIKDEDGTHAVGCPSLPGCWSQGDTREQAIANIREAIVDYLEVSAEIELRTAPAAADAAELLDEGMVMEKVSVDVVGR